MSIDNCLIPDVNRVETSSITSTSNGNGEYTLSQIKVFEAGFIDNVGNTVYGNSLTRAVNKYPDFYENLNKINSTVLQSPFVKEQIPNYEILAIKQTELGNISLSPFEFAEYIKDNNLTPITANFMANQNPPKFLQSLDDYLRDGFANSIMGGFCGMMPNVFGAIGAFFGIIGQVGGLINDALSFIAKIRNIKDPLKALFDAIKVKALIEAIKEKVTKAVMGVVNKIKSAIENFDVAGIANQVESLVKNTVGKKLAQLQEGIMGFFTEENMKKIKDKITGMIDYAVGLFDNPSVEEIMFLISRICGFAAGIETLIQGLKDPLDKTADRFIQGYDMLKANSGLTTASVIAAGGIRMDDVHRKAMIEQQRKVLADAGNVKKEGPAKYKGVPSWDQIKDGNHPIIKPEVGHSANTRAGWEGLEIDTRAAVVKLWKLAQLGTPFIGRSFYRSQEHQDRLYKMMLDGKLKKGSVAKVSEHTSGKAVDIHWKGFDPYGVKTNIVVDLARTLGFNGIGYYNEFIHIDLRAKYQPWDFRDKPEATQTQAPAATTKEEEELYPDAKVLLDVYDGKYKDGDYVMFEGKSQRVNLIAEETADFEAQYSIGG